MSAIRDEVPQISNEDLGYSDFFEANRNKLEWDSLAVARVIAEYRGAYKVKNVSGEYLAKITGKQMFDAETREDYPAVGDWVVVSSPTNTAVTIRGILPRRTIIKRKYSGQSKAQVIAANIDVAFIIESVDRDYNLNRWERYFAIANDGGVRPAIILNKTDLISAELLEEKLAQIKDRFKDIDVIATSTLDDEGLDELSEYIKKGNTYCFLGSSGVGKSSLINKLIGKNEITTGGIGRSGRGKHITTAREMYWLESGGIVVDNPGMREVGMTNAKAGIDDLFDQISVLTKKCKYVDCSHTHEPGCAVLDAVESGKLNEGKYFNYIRLKKEAEYYEMSEFDRKEKDRQFGKFINKAKKDLRRYKHKGYGG